MWLALALLTLVLSRPDAAGPPPEPLHPREYASPSGAWVLSVDPSDRHGAGPARYRMTCSGVLVWKREHPFTFQDAFVSDAGVAVGYAYVGEASGVFREELVIAALEVAAGDPVDLERTPIVQAERSFSTYPRVHGLAVYPALERVVLQLTLRDHRSEWRVRSSATGEALASSVTRPAYPEEQKWIVPEVIEDVDVPTVELSCVVLGSHRLEVPPGPGELRFALLDPFDRLWFVDWKSFGLHAFDRSGRWLLVAQPAPEDLGKGLLSRLPQWTAVRPDGVVLVREVSGLIEFTPHGERVQRTGEKDYRVEPRVFLPGDRGSWRIDSRFRRVERADAAGELLHASERGANRRWLRWLRHPVAGTDGSLAVRDLPHSGSDAWLQVFAPTGAPRSSHRIPEHTIGLAFDGRRAAFVHAGRVLGLDVLGDAPPGVLAWQPPADVHGLAFTPDGELLVLAGRTLHRLLVP